MSEAAAPGMLELLRVAAALALVAALIVLSGWALRRGGAARRRGVLAVQDRVALARGVQLVVVSAEGRRLVLGVAERNVQLVTELEPVEPCEAVEPAADAGTASAAAAAGPAAAAGASRVVDALVARWRGRAR